MKIIFLDIDGILNTYRTMSTMKEVKTRRFGQLVGFNQFDKDCVARINKITDETGAKIVISSSWRTGCVRNDTVDLLFNHLKKQGVTGEIIDVTPLDKECGYINEEYPDGSRGYRAFEIQAWLNKRDDVESFVILDDDAGFMGKCDLEKNFVWVEFGWKTGIQDVHTDRAIKILNR